ncbi:uncharacterized protein LOC127644186 [Xyrauchen texanus]|uniref:uncharacterized protein LOC127644186 n=1 Tax=Xyrauchen texanus TaxID=154827 RepID=UPI0022429353|nr:uncharacterized protein LOC127644186 [Xyrauchen texanus]
MGKALHEDDLFSELLMFEGPTQMFVRQEFYLDVLHHFSQCAAKNNLKIFLKLDGSSTLELTWDSTSSTTITKAEKTTLNALSKLVNSTVMDIINEVTENPLRTAEIVRQGKKAGMQSSDATSRCFEHLDEAELLGRRSPKPDVMPENEMLSLSAGRKDEAEEKEEEIDIEELLGKDASPAPTERSSHHTQESRLHSASIKHECSCGNVDQGLYCQPDCQHWAVEENRNSTRRPETPMEVTPEASFILPYHLIESIVEGLVSQLEATFDVNIPGIYLCDRLVDNVVKGLEKLTEKKIIHGRSRQHWSTNDTTISNIVDEAHDILAQKRYLRAAWYEDEMAVAYMTVILSAVVFDYTMVHVKAQTSDCTPYGSRAESCSPVNSEKELIQACASTTDSDDSSTEMRPGTYLVEREDSDQGDIDEDLIEERRSPSLPPRQETPKAKRGRSLLSRIRASLSRIFRRKK